jgi:hypothetical protein
MMPLITNKKINKVEVHQEKELKKIYHRMQNYLLNKSLNNKCYLRKMQSHRVLHLV